MIFRSKVTLLAVLSIIYLFFFVIPRLSSDIDDPDLVEPSWRWQYTRPATLPSYRAAPPPPTDAIVESSIYTLLNPPPNGDNHDNDEQQQPTPTPPIEQEQQQQQQDAPSYDPDEKFITFFTHSGFQNQLIQVENGILLAWYLNRTLILPRALLGEAFGWSYFGKLHLEHMLHDPVKENDSTMPATDICEFLADDLAFWDVPCPDRSRHSVVPFDEIFDLSWAKEHVRIVLRERSDFDWLEEKYHIRRAGVPDQGNGSYVDGDILFFKGATRYDWRIFDTPRKSHRLGKYAESLDIFELRKRQEKLIHFSSLFGTGKLPIRRPEHYEFLRTLQRSITYRHPAVLAVAEQIVETLGGQGNFIGLHVRSGDGWFVKALPENIYSIVSQIGKALESRSSTSQQQKVITSSTSTPPNLQQCLTMAKRGEATMIYLATDARSPRDNPAFAPIWQRYPCTFTLDEVISLEAWDALDRVLDPNTGNSMRKFLLPLVDASVASRGWFFIGSKGSTFSGYIYRLHDVFWSNAKKQQLIDPSSSS
ncbi:hypothetical protein RO3G_13655 [Lichtheimia corymbifera JMRC:FSU:9682]|uniref:GDP-fucose protein O-fucosyltransferase 2 n=1 Tax=Lichtheimia corymbifera JMRC:FSU:9682 TaxID=1263082 RepID=A0A068SD93_9FUNG|nr:hypothetical protein RO3G_13655 [Lichtheimia corymbifera JMRC:FSU:9682]